ncbi:hypothetical protein K227x_64630 [Rubripirellula lacrimiformis]|uniref:DUF4404 domain-containing protein n=1 Tax=Rubripirellula lacrimiformis TaxID=1930273 RepID=A0A517NLT2_9BACT|nr:DUF4404 family protein [Rubripirellula lacrimiformis]QDT08033.1 hypothetical protein K227x_64630 [Rubripirellula lacrimiformis]
MNHRELTEALEVVHRELSDAQDLDPQDVEKLQTTMAEIEVVLKKNSQTTSQLSDNVTHAATTFEQSHPRLTETLGRIADMLQQMGI